MKLNLKRPIVFFDLETTGTNVLKDRIVELSYIKVYPDGSEIDERYLVNPGCSIPAEVTAIHHISDDDVKDAPAFRDIAQKIAAVFEDSDIAGYNSNRFDLPLLQEEFARVGILFDIHKRNIIDVQNIFYKKEPRTLIAAYRFYCNGDLSHAHSASADTKATYEVLKSQLERYDDLENDMEYLAKFTRMGNSLDLSGRIVAGKDGEPEFNFGKHKGKKVRDVFRREPSFYHWMMEGDFARDTKNLVTTIYYEIYSSQKKR